MTCSFTVSFRWKKWDSSNVRSRSAGKVVAISVGVRKNV